MLSRIVCSITFPQTDEVNQAVTPWILLMSFLQASYQRSLLSWGPGLWPCYLSCSFLAESWIPPYYGNCSQDCSTFTCLPSSFSLVSMRSRRAPCWWAYLSHVLEVTIIRALHKLSGLLVHCCVILSINIKVAKVPHEDQDQPPANTRLLPAAWRHQALLLPDGASL